MTSITKLLLASLLTFASACADDDAPDLAEATATSGTRAHFDVWQTGGQHYFHVVAGNGEVMLTSQGYGNRTSALNGVLSVLDNGALESRYQIFPGSDGQSYVRLRAGNGQTIAVTEGYTTSANARRAVATSVAAVAGYLEHWAAATGARFTVFEGADRAFYFDLRAQNGAKVLRSQGYASEAAALNGAFLVAERGVEPAAYAIQPAADGGAYFNLRAANGQTIATSEIYASRGNAERARDAIVALLPEVELL